MDGAACELLLRRDQIEVRKRASAADELAKAEHRRGGRSVEWPLSFVWPRPDVDIRLRIEIDRKATLAGFGEAGGEIDGGRRLPDAALLIRDSDEHRAAISQD